VADAAKWREKFTKGDADEQFLAIESVRTAPDASAALPLIELAIASPHAHLALACGAALAAIGPAPFADADVTKAIQSAVKAKEDSRQINLARVLAAWGEPVVDKVLAQLISGRRAPEVQAEALFLCGLLPVPQPGSFPEVTQAVLVALDKGRTEEIRMGASSTAGTLRLNAAAEPLAEIARRGADKYASLYAVLALQRIGWKGGLSSFLHVLGQTPTDEARNACLKAVVELAGHEDIPELLSMTRSSKKDYRDAAALALARLLWAVQVPQGPVVTPAAPPPPPPPVPSDVIDRLINGAGRHRVGGARRRAHGAAAHRRAGDGEGLRAPAGAGGLQRRRHRLHRDGTLRPLRRARRAEVAAQDRGPRGQPHAAHVRRARSRGPRCRGRRGRAGQGPAAARQAPDERAQRRARAGLHPPQSASTRWIALLEQPGWSPAMLREIEFALERLTGHRFGARSVPVEGLVPAAKA
jgi:hypothetical protein